MKKSDGGSKFFHFPLSTFLFFYYLCTRLEAQMAESVDALVSNTSGATRAGSTPALGTRSTTTCWSQRKAKCCKSTTYGTFLFSTSLKIFPTFSPPMQI